MPDLKRSGQFMAVASMLALGLAACGSGSPTAGSTPPPSAPATVAQSPTTIAPSATPSSASPTPTATPKPSVTPTSPPKTTTTKYVFPVSGHVSYGHTHHDYPATDMIANCGLTFRSPVNGVVLEVDRKDTWKPSTNLGPVRGGLSISIKGDDGVRYYGSHFSKIDTFVQPGLRVTAGENLAVVGQTGDARLSVCHVHFGISPICAGTGDWYNRRGLIYPWPYLDSWRNGGHLSPVAAVKAWQSKHGCPKKPLTDP